VVDDDALVLDSLRRVLSDEFEVTTTIRPEEAIEWISAGESYDVILCDVMMPVLNGVDFRDRVEGVSPEQAARIVFVTGGLLFPQVRSALDRVANTVLEKPIDLEGLRELIRRRVRAAWQAPGRAI
jgi:CheY-like chemotaxis protein